MDATGIAQSDAMVGGVILFGLAIGIVPVLGISIKYWYSIWPYCCYHPCWSSAGVAMNHRYCWPG